MTRLFHMPSAPPGTRSVSRPTLDLHPGGFFVWREVADVRWWPEHQSYVVCCPKNGEVLYEVPAPFGQRRKLHRKLLALAKDVKDLRATGPKRERALARAGL